jgi:DMSO/TMAO reductase YedYZ heme-binding membrane subunit
MSQNPSQPANSAGSIIATAMGLSLAYAVLRYNFVGPTPWKDLPFLILNKGIALCTILLLALNFGLGPLKNLGVGVPDRWLNARRALGMTGFLLALVHVLMSFLLFKPAVFGKFFEADRTLTLTGGLSMLFGVLSFVVLWGYNLSFQTKLSEDREFIQFITSRRFLLVAMLLSGGHIFFMGFESWLTPSGWHGGLPPVTLVSFAVFAVSYTVNLLGRE